ncbi:MAG: diphthine synthase [Candidatus Woesearchaeota archaeon]|nr:diphthine synthase [Candidatus Woesearchaeota archaeon]
MGLYIIGIGLSDEKDITLKGLEIVKKADFVYLESYTSVLQVSIEKLEKFYGKKIIKADRGLVENKPDEMLERAKKKNVAFLVIGDPLSATTHIDIMRRAEEKGVEVKVIFNASVLTAVGMAGLQLYKFGKTISIPFPDKVKTEVPYNAIKANKKAGMHTLLLLDLDPDNKRFLSIGEAIDVLLKIEKEKKENVFAEDAFIIGCARLGSDDYIIKYGKAKDIKKIDFGNPPFCIVIPGELHFMEEEALEKYEI